MNVLKKSFLTLLLHVRCVCVVCARVCLLTRKRLTLLLLRLPLTVDVEGAAPAVGQPETLLLLPALAARRASHRLQTEETTSGRTGAPRARRTGSGKKKKNNAMCGAKHGTDKV